MRSDSNMIMMPSELMIKKIKPLLFWLLLLALLSWSIMSQSRSLLVSSACQVDYIFLMASQAISKMMLYKTIWTDTFHVAGGDSFWHDKNTSQGQMLRRQKYQILKEPEHLDDCCFQCLRTLFLKVPHYNIVLLILNLLLIVTV